MNTHAEYGNDLFTHFNSKNLHSINTMTCVTAKILQV